MSTKVILNIYQTGIVKKQKEVSEQINYCITKQDLTKSKITLKNGDDVIEKSSKIHYPLVETVCKQVIKISDVAYKAMVTECPSDVKKGKWTEMSKEQRLNYHFNLISLDLKGTSFDFEIL